MQTRMSLAVGRATPLTTQWPAHLYCLKREPDRIAPRGSKEWMNERRGVTHRSIEAGGSVEPQELGRCLANPWVTSGLAPQLL
jgi:hypothetical protein